VYDEIFVEKCQALNEFLLYREINFRSCAVAPFFIHHKRQQRVKNVEFIENI